MSPESIRWVSLYFLCRQHPKHPNIPARKQFKDMLSTIRRDKLYKVSHY